MQSMQEIKKAIMSDLPRMMETEPEIRDFILRLTREMYAGKQETNDRFVQMMEELKKRQGSERKEMAGLGKEVGGGAESPVGTMGCPGEKMGGLGKKVGGKPQVPERAMGGLGKEMGGEPESSAGAMGSSGKKMGSSGKKMGRSGKKMGRSGGEMGGKPKSSGEEMGRKSKGH